MPIKKYDELSSYDIDALRELGSIGSGSAATALSGVLNRKVILEVPQIKILDNNEVINMLGGPEKIVAGVLVHLTGEIEGIMLYVQSLGFINEILKNIMSRSVTRYEELNEMETSALLEVGNIMMSSYVRAISSMTNLNTEISVPAICINMLGAIASVPMAEYGHEVDKMMLVDGNIQCDGSPLESNLIMVPSVSSLALILKKMGVICD